METEPTNGRKYLQAIYTEYIKTFYTTIIKRQLTNFFKQAKDLNRHFCKEDIQLAHKHMRTCSPSVIIRDVQIKTTVKYNFTTFRMAGIKKTGNNKDWDFSLVQWLTFNLQMQGVQVLSLAGELRSYMP